LYFSNNITIQNFVPHIKWHYRYFHLKFSDPFLVDFRVFEVGGGEGEYSINLNNKEDTLLSQYLYKIKDVTMYTEWRTKNRPAVS